MQLREVPNLRFRDDSRQSEITRKIVYMFAVLYFVRKKKEKLKTVMFRDTKSGLEKLLKSRSELETEIAQLKL